MRSLSCSARRSVRFCRRREPYVPRPSCARASRGAPCVSISAVDVWTLLTFAITGCCCVSAWNPSICAHWVIGPDPVGTVTSWASFSFSFTARCCTSFRSTFACVSRSGGEQVVRVVDNWFSSQFAIPRQLSRVRGRRQSDVAHTQSVYISATRQRQNQQNTSRTRAFA